MLTKLKASKADGDSRSAWAQDELMRLANKNGLSEEQTEQLITDIAAACERELKTTLTEGE